MKKLIILLIVFAIATPCFAIKREPKVPFGTGWGSRIDQVKGAKFFKDEGDHQVYTVTRKTASYLLFRDNKLFEYRQVRKYTDQNKIMKLLKIPYGEPDRIPTRDGEKIVKAIWTGKETTVIVAFPPKKNKYFMYFKQVDPLDAELENYKRNKSKLILGFPGSPMIHALNHSANWPWGKPVTDAGNYFGNRLVVDEKDPNVYRVQLLGIEANVHGITLHFDDGLSKVVMTHPGKLPKTHLYARMKKINPRYHSGDQVNYCLYLNHTMQMRLFGKIPAQFSDGLEGVVNGVKWKGDFNCEDKVTMTFEKTYHSKDAFKIVLNYQKVVGGRIPSKPWKKTILRQPPNDAIKLENGPGVIYFNRNIAKQKAGTGIHTFMSPDRFVKYSRHFIKDWGWTVNELGPKARVFDHHGVKTYEVSGIIISPKNKRHHWFHRIALIHGAFYEVKFIIFAGSGGLKQIWEDKFIASSMHTGLDILDNYQYVSD